MKKFLSFFMLLVILTMSSLTFISCGQNDDDDNDEPVASEGYTLYDNGDIIFEYPEDWTVTNGSVVQIMNPKGVGNNITITYQAQSKIMDELTVEDFNKYLLPAYKSAGASISNVAVSHPKNENNVNITKITYTITMSGQSMKQTQYAVNANKKNYVITVTEATTDTTLVTNIFNSLYVK